MIYLIFKFIKINKNYFNIKIYFNNLHFLEIYLKIKTNKILIQDTTLVAI